MAQHRQVDQSDRLVSSRRTVLLEDIRQPLCMKHTLAQSSFAMGDSLALTSSDRLGNLFVWSNLTLDIVKVKTHSTTDTFGMAHSDLNGK